MKTISKAKYKISQKVKYFNVIAIIINSVYNEWGGWYYDIEYKCEGETLKTRIEQEYLMYLDNDLIIRN